jgi:hypothetical protein
VFTPVCVPFLIIEAEEVLVVNLAETEVGGLACWGITKWKPFKLRLGSGKIPISKNPLVTRQFWIVNYSTVINGSHPPCFPPSPEGGVRSQEFLGGKPPKNSCC